MEDQRRNPEALLAQIQAQEENDKGGKLKIFLGAAPGVGKTYAMLQEANLRKNQGVDVVVGLVETHGRQDTGKLIGGLEILPKQNIEYKGQVLQEFDLDAAIARKPGLILVDEMAHTNAPTCRHAKRWQDIQELLNRGIDVFTTLNVQHLESLNDVIQQIIGVKVRETLPDSMLEEAEIELVDLPPDDLLKRLAEGKVYFKEQAKLAIKNFFKKSNLTALRELALRVTAEQVNMDVMSERKFQDSQEMWATADKLLVCVGPGEGSAKLVRAAKRLANSLHAEWMALYVDAPRLNLSQEQKDNVGQNLRLAEQLGAETLVVGGDDLVAEIIRVARERNVTKIVISKHIRPQWRNLLKGSLVDQLVRNSGEIDIYVIRADDQFAKETHHLKSPTDNFFWPGYVFAAIVVAGCTGTAFLLNASFTFSNLIMVYLLGLVIVAGLGRYGPSLFASVASVLSLDFFFVPPIYSFVIKRSEYIFTFAVMLVIGNVISYLTIKIRQQAERSRLREKRTYSILALTKELASHRGLGELIQISTQQIAEVFDSEVLALLVDENDALKIVAGYPKIIELEDKEFSVAKWAYDMEQSAGLGTGTLPYSEAIYIPLIGAKATLGVLRMKPLYPKRFFEAEQMDLLKAFVNQTALAVEVDRLDR